MKAKSKLAFRSIMLLMCSNLAIADMTTDYYIQDDSASLAQSDQDGIANLYQKQIDWLLAQGYSPTSIILSSVGRGMTLADTIYYMSRSQPQDADQFYKAAETLLPSLPGWVCSANGGGSHRYDKPLKKEDLPANGTLEEISKKYFDEHQRFLNEPDWKNGEGHAEVSIDELLKYKKEEMEANGEVDDQPVESWWFQEEAADSNGVLTVGLYPYQQRVIINARYADLEAMKNQGKTTVPILVMYNEDNQIPTSDIERIPGLTDGSGNAEDEKSEFIDPNDGEITASEVIQKFEADGQRLAPAREWRIGDYHLMTRTEELLKLLEVPEKDTIDPQQWAAAEERLQKEQIKPIHMSLYSDAKGERWVDDPVMLAVAKEMGIDRVPVVFFYHGDERQQCAMPTACLDDVKKAAEAGSDRDDLFTEPTPKTTPTPLLIPPGRGAISPN